MGNESMRSEERFPPDLVYTPIDGTSEEAIPSHGEKVLPFFRMPNSAKDSLDSAFTTDVGRATVRCVRRGRKFQLQVRWERQSRKEGENR